MRAYEIVISTSVVELAELVNRQIDLGYMPCGSGMMILENEGRSIRYAQAVVRMEAMLPNIASLVKRQQEIPQPVEIKTRAEALAKEVHEFILWLTPCGQVNPCPSIKLIGREARKLNKKLLAHSRDQRPPR